LANRLKFRENFGFIDMFAAKAALATLENNFGWRVESPQELRG
jgi:hypothetical protein